MHGVTGGLAFCRNFHYESSRVSPGLLETEMGTARCASRRGSDLGFSLYTSMIQPHYSSGIHITSHSSGSCIIVLYLFDCVTYSTVVLYIVS